MKRFDFPLERVRRWRLEQQNLEELKLQQLRAEKEGLSAGRRQIQAELDQTAQLLLAQPSLESLELQSLDSFRLYVRGRVRDLDQRERECESKIVEQRGRLLEARRQFELLDRLRKTAFGTWRAAVDKEYEDLAAELFLARKYR